MGTVYRFGPARERRRSANTSAILGQLFGHLRAEGFTVSYTMEDFQRQYAKEHFAQLTPEERREALESLSPEELLGVLSAEQIEQYLVQLNARRSAGVRTRRRKK